MHVAEQLAVYLTEPLIFEETAFNRFSLNIEILRKFYLELF
jgi:hypothetical protein